MLVTQRNTLSTAAQGAKTATYKAQSSNIRNKGYVGFKLTVNIKAGATGTVTPTVSEYDESGNAIKTWSLGAISSGINIMEVYPALTAGGNVYNDILGELYNATMTISNGGSLTFDAVLDLIP